MDRLKELWCIYKMLNSCMRVGVSSSLSKLRDDIILEALYQFCDEHRYTPCDLPGEIQLKQIWNNRNNPNLIRTISIMHDNGNFLSVKAWKKMGLKIIDTIPKFPDDLFSILNEECPKRKLLGFNAQKLSSWFN